MVGETYVYVHKDGFHVYEITQYYAEGGPHSKNYNYEAKMLHGEDEGQLFNYLLDEESFSSLPYDESQFGFIREMN